MSYEVSSYPVGTFSWADFFSIDRDASRAFYENLFGWTSEDMPTGEERPDYTMFFLNGKAVAGGSPAYDPNMPSIWASYITVDDIDAMTQKVTELGGTVVMEPMDVLDSGRMAGIQDPTGAMVNLWQPKNHIGAQIVNTTGAMCWNELNTRDVAGAKKFYGDLLGWTFETDDSGYTSIKNGERWNGGIFQITPEMGDFPPYWAVYFTVDNLDESVKKVSSLGGMVHMPSKDIGVGKIAVVADPAGAVITIMEMNDEPNHWEE